MNLKHFIPDFSTRHYKLITVVVTTLTIAIAITATLPSVWPEVFTSLKSIRIDTDPENMLPADEPVRVFHNQMKKELSLYDMVVVGIVNNKNQDGVFNPDTLRNIYELTEYAKTLHWQENGQEKGVVEVDLIAPSTVDNIVIFLLMLIFFRKLVLIIAPMIIAAVSVILTMGMLIIAGFPVHIMSSMIPIFIMPIAVLNSVHIISEFFEQYQQTKDRRKTIVNVMDELFLPMLYTSLTTTAGFGSLALTPIPPVQVFGIFVSIGVMLAWALTITFIPAYIMFIKPETLVKFGVVHIEGEDSRISALGRFLQWLGIATYHWAKHILVVAVVVIVVAIYGISKININDNPVRWFTKNHPIRVADRVLNKHFGGTYMAYLALSAEDKEFNPKDFIDDFNKQARAQANELEDELPQAAKVFAELQKIAADPAKTAQSRQEVFEKISYLVAEKSKQAEEDAIDAWDEASLFVAQQKQRNQIFKDPAVLKYQAQLQQALLETKIVGKSNSLADIIKTVHRELLQGKDQQFRIPDTSNAVAQCMITFQSSHRPGDLWHFVTPDYRKSSIWVQLKSGDNRDMTRVVRAIDKYVIDNPPPIPLKFKWFGLTYINVVWQKKMVIGMLQAFTGSFLVVLLMMIVLFRSSLWALLSMVPLTITIGFIYGAVGLVGKDYDMPVAILSSMTLGLAVDFAIHFLVRGRRMYSSLHSWEKTAPAVFAEPARAITRNIIVIAVGFLPLLLAPLTPYKTVGTLLAFMLLTAGVGTLLMLPALVKILEKHLFATKKVMGPTCNCAACVISSVTLVLLVTITLHQYPVMVIGCGLLSRRQKCKLQNVQEETKND